MRREATVLQPDLPIEEIDDDPDDNVFLECAVAGTIDYLISGDDHLLEVGAFRGVEIVTADEFLQRY